MKKIILLFLIDFLVAAVVHGQVSYDARLLTKTGSIWHKTSGEFKNEYYNDYLYDGDVVFRVLIRYSPQVDGKIKTAREHGGRIVIKNTVNLFFDSPELIDANFSVVPGNQEHVFVDPDALELSTARSGCFGTKKRYYVSFSAKGRVFEISRKMYTQIATRVDLANNNQLLKIDPNVIARGKIKHNEKFIEIVDKEEAEEADALLCAICLERPKNMLLEPCDHACICEECAQKDIKQCPLCKGNITKKKKIFL